MVRAISTQAALGEAEIASLNEGKGEGARVSLIEVTPWGDAQQIERYRLGNGLTVLVLVDAAAPVFTYQTWLAVGSRHERAGKTGLCHLFEHLMFNEAEGLPKGEFDRKLEEQGAESNAATWVDWTYYYENVPSAALELVVSLEAERLSRLVLREPQVVSEKEVVANERRQRVDDDVDGAVNELLFKTAFTKHGYGWPTIGWMADIEGFTVDDCQTFYKTYYAPNNATIVVVGDVDRKALLSQVQRCYGPMTASTIPVEDVKPEPPQTEERRLEVSKPTEAQRVVIGYHGPSLGDADHVPLSLLNEVLFGGRASRMHQALVQVSELAIDCRGWVSTFKDPGLYEISATARPGVTAEQVLELIDRELERVVAGPVADDELERVKAKVELGALQGMETCSGRGEQIGFYETVLGEPAAALTRLRAVRRATVTDLLRVARRYLVRQSRSVIVVRAALAEGDDEGEGAEGAEGSEEEVAA